MGGDRVDTGKGMMSEGGGEGRGNLGKGIRREEGVRNYVLTQLMGCYVKQKK